MNSEELYQGIDLSGQVVIVTGASRGLGKVYAQFLARAGATVAVMARTASELDETVALIEQEGGRATAHPADVTDREAVGRVVSEVEDQLGPVDLLVNNAGIFGTAAPIWELDADEWWRIMEVNVRGPLLCSQAVLRSMVGRGSGRIINTASGAGIHRPDAYLSGYAVSKTALIRLTESIYVEASQHGVSVFVISPGFVFTPLVKAFAGTPGDEKWLGGRFRKALAESSGAPPERAAELVVLLASGRADVLSGCYITVRDDVADMIARSEEIHRDELRTLRLRT